MTKTKVSKKREIASYMESHGLPYELKAAGNVYGAIASAGSQVCVMAQTYHAEAGDQYFVGYYPGNIEARLAQRAILEADPRKRFVQSVIIVKGN